MNRFRRLLLTVVAVALVVAPWGCAGDDFSSGGGDGGGVYRYPRGADDTVIRYDVLGGVQPEASEFLALPTVLIAGDGSVYTPAAVVTPYPGPLVPQLSVRGLTRAGLDAVLGVADANGLLAAGAPSAGSPSSQEAWVRVEINAEGGAFVHMAPARGTSGADTTDQAWSQLQAFIDVLNQLETVAGSGQLGLARAYVPEQYRVRAVPVDPAELVAGGTEPRVVPWPADVGVRLATAADCAIVEAELVRATFEAADQVTLFRDGAQTYRLFVAPRLPVDADC